MAACGLLGCCSSPHCAALSWAPAPCGEYGVALSVANATWLPGTDDAVQRLHLSCVPVSSCWLSHCIHL